MAWLSRLAAIVRAPFLLLVPACLAPAYAVAYVEQGFVEPVAALLVFMAALSAHIGVNALNEYDDFRSGLDFATDKTPFSGGSGTLIRYPEMAPAARVVGWLAVFVTLAVGVHFLLRVGSAVVAPGLLGIAIIITYTRWINRFPLLCLVVPGVGFGLLFINLGVIVLTGAPSATGFLVSLPVALLASNLLLVNQLPDAAADRAAGRNHIAIAWGPDRARRFSLALIVLAYASLVCGWWLGTLPATVLLALLTVPLGLRMLSGLFSRGDDRKQRLVAAMGQNTLLTLVTPVLLAVGLLLAE